ncbi:MAG: protein kinase [Myxococcaceae bacterium]|nr:protein kinase [Myxococcaceae bacterium]
MPGRYQLIKKLATGGMAEVFLARAAGPGGFEKTLVVKRILPQLAERESFVRMFFAEARIAAQLTHPNIVQIFDFGEDEGSYFIAMEYVDGVTLRAVSKWAQANTPLAPALAAKLVSLAAEGLGWAHGYANPETGEPLGLVHRDVSADNIMVSRTGAVKVLDFGVVRVDGEENGTQNGALKGKVSYMPREQIVGLPLDGRVDVYALGVVLFVLLTGERPYEKPSEISLMHAILNEAPRPLSDFRADVPEGLVAIVERAMGKTPDERYASCLDLQEALEQFIASQGAVVTTAHLGQLAARVQTSLPGAESRGTGSRSGTGAGSKSDAGSGSGVRLATSSGPRPAPMQAAPEPQPAPAPPAPELAAAEPPPELGEEVPTSVELRAIPAPIDPFKTTPGLPAPTVLAALRAREAAREFDPGPEPTTVPNAPAAAVSAAGPAPVNAPAAPAAAEPLPPAELAGLNDVPVMNPVPKMGWWNERTPLSSPSAQGLLSTPAQGLAAARPEPAATPPGVQVPSSTPDVARVVAGTPVVSAPSLVQSPEDPSRPPGAPRASSPSSVSAAMPPPGGAQPRPGAPAPSGMPPPGGAPARPSSPSSLGPRPSIPPPVLGPSASPPVPFSSRESGRITAPPREAGFRVGPAVPGAPATWACAPTRGQPIAVLSSLRTAVVAERSSLLVRKFFPVAARLMEASPDLVPWIGWHAGSVLSAALVAEEHAALARLVERVATAPNGGGRFGAWLRAELSSPRVWLHLLERLRRGLPSDAGALEQWIAGLGPPAAPVVIVTIEQLEAGPAQDLLARALASMVGDPALIIERLEAPNAKHLAVWAHVLERCPSALERKKVFARLLARRDVPLVMEVMAGRAKVVGPETLQQLEAGLGGRSDEVRRRALDVMAELAEPRVVRVLLPLVTDAQFDKRPDAERASMVHALVSAKEPSVFQILTQLCSEKATMLNRKRLVQQRLPIVEGVGRGKSDDARRWLEAVAGDGAQPDEVREAARAQLARAKGPVTSDRLTPEQAVRLRRLVVLDLLALIRGALATDAGGGLFEGALGRLREELRLLVMQEGRFELSVASDGVAINGAPVAFPFAGASIAPEVAQLLATCDLRTFRIDGPVPVTELRAALLQLADPDGTSEKAPHVQVSTFSGRVVQPIQHASTSGDATGRSVDLVTRAIAFVREQRDPVAVGRMIPLAGIDAILREWVQLAKSGAWRLMALSAAPAGERAAVHAVNTACIATAFAADLQLDAAALRELAELSLVWTLGEAGVPADVASTPGNPMPDELRLRLGLVFLSQCKHRRGPAAAVTAFEVGLERPTNPQVRGAGVTASIFAIAEAWDAIALEDERGHAAALELLRTRHARRFSPELFGLFLNWVDAQRA